MRPFSWSDDHPDRGMHILIECLGGKDWIMMQWEVNRQIINSIRDPEMDSFPGYGIYWPKAQLRHANTPKFSHKFIERADTVWD